MPNSNPVPVFCYLIVYNSNGRVFCVRQIHMPAPSYVGWWPYTSLYQVAGRIYPRMRLARPHINAIQALPTVAPFVYGRNKQTYVFYATWQQVVAALTPAHSHVLAKCQQALAPAAVTPTPASTP